MRGFSGTYHSPEEVEKIMCETENKAMACGTNAAYDGRTSEQIMVDTIREDLGVVIEPQAWRMFIRARWQRLAPIAHRIHEGAR